jgi:hypothetical protein
MKIKLGTNEHGTPVIITITDNKINMLAIVKSTGKILKVKKITEHFIVLYLEKPFKILFDIEIDIKLVYKNQVELIKC